MRLRSHIGNVTKLLVGVPLVLAATTVGFISSSAANQPGPSSCNGNVQPANPNGHPEALLANLTPSSGSKVQPGSTIQVLYTDETPMGSSTASTPSPTVTIDGNSVTPTVTPTSGVTPTYVNPSDGGSEGTQCQDWISIPISHNIKAGQHSGTITAYDSDNDHETITFTFSTKTPARTSGIDTSQSLTPNDEGFVLNGQEASGTMTFSLYPPSEVQCKHTPAFTETVPVSNGVGMTNNTSFIATQPGKWRWVVTYSGDSTHPAASSPCGFEYFVINNDHTTNR
jgi:hypothetical protein